MLTWKGRLIEEYLQVKVEVDKQLVLEICIEMLMLIG